jgi:hypothetical protein
MYMYSNVVFHLVSSFKWNSNTMRTKKIISLMISFKLSLAVLNGRTVAIKMTEIACTPQNKPIRVSTCKDSRKVTITQSMILLIRNTDM